MSSSILRVNVFINNAFKCKALTGKDRLSGPPDFCRQARRLLHDSDHVNHPLLCELTQSANKATTSTTCHADPCCEHAQASPAPCWLRCRSARWDGNRACDESYTGAIDLTCRAGDSRVRRLLSCSAHARHPKTPFVCRVSLFMRHQPWQLRTTKRTRRRDQVRPHLYLRMQARSQASIKQ